MYEEARTAHLTSGFCTSQFRPPEPFLFTEVPGWSLTANVDPLTGVPSVFMPSTPTTAQSGSQTPLGRIHPIEAREHVSAMRERHADADPTALLPDIDPRRIPRHIAIIMDGNGRWAESKGMPRVFGHRNGATAVRTAMETVVELGVECLTLYSFSLENWKRPEEEIGQLMQLYVAYLEGERQVLVDRNIRFRQIGRRDGMPSETLAALDEMVAATAHCTGPTLCLAVNYGSRDEIVEAARSLARDVRSEALDPDDIDEGLFDQRLYTSGLPEPDLLIRTAGERRISNFLLWQISYAELYITPVLWPEFGRDQMLEAVRDFASRERRFGGLGGASA